MKNTPPMATQNPNQIQNQALMNSLMSSISNTPRSNISAPSLPISAPPTNAGTNQNVGLPGYGPGAGSTPPTNAWNLTSVDGIKTPNQTTGAYNTLMEMLNGQQMNPQINPKMGPKSNPYNLSLGQTSLQ